MTGRHDDGAFTIATAILISRIRTVLESEDTQLQVLDVGCAGGAELPVEQVLVDLHIADVHPGR